MPMPKKDSKITDVENEHFKIKKHLKNKLDRSSKEIKTSKKTGTIKKTTSAQNIKNEEVQKLNQPEPSNKETFSLHKSKTSEIINTKPIGKMAKRTEKQHDNGQLKIVANDTLIPPRESKNSQSENIDKKNFPMFLIDVDKMSKEIKPELDSKKCQICQVPHEKIVDFPLHNQNKKLLFKAPFRILNHGPASDPMLRSELKLFPSITKILNSTIPESSREILREWRKNMIDELGENGFKSFYKGQLINGNKFNWELHNFLLIGEKHKQESNNLSLKSIDNVLRRTSDLSAINSHVIHRKLAYRGVIDCVAKYKNKPVLIEWKRLENPEVKVSNSSIDMAATQLSAYVGALNFDETYKFQISGGLLVLAYNDGSEAEVIEINHEQCYKYWKMWLTRLQKYQESRKKTT
nr:mitochondrial genome maintenance exonuclease 1-like [Halyomorpha halys]